MIQVKPRTLFTTLFAVCIASHFWWPLLTNISIMLIALFWLIDGKGKRLVRALRSIWTYIFSIPFFLTAFSLVWTDNMDLGAFMLEKRLAIFIFPLLFAGLKRDELNVNFVIDTIWGSFLISSLAGLLHSIWVILSGKGGTEYLYSDLLAEPFIDQAVYMAFYVNIVLALIIYQIILKKGILYKYKWLKFAVIPYLLIVHFLLASRMSLLVLLIVFLLFLVFWLFRRLSWRKNLLIIGGIIGLGIALSIVFPKTLNRFKLVNRLEFDYKNPNPLNHFNGEANELYWTGVTARLAIWGSILNNLEELPVEGYGAGDVETALNEGFELKEFKLGIDNNFNSHNQYLDYLLGYGYLGLLLFIGAYLVIMIHGFMTKNWLLVVVLGICLLSFMTENILNRNMGIIMVAFILPFLFFRRSENYTKS